MKKLGLITATAFLLVLLIIAGATVWIKGHKEEIARSVTGKNIRFADLAIQYTPMPSIVLTDLTWTEGNYACTIPKLSLYPDLSEIFSGRIHLRKTILESPLFVAQGMNNRQSNDAGRHPSTGNSYSMETFPNGVVRVNEGKIILQGAPGNSLPVFVTAQAEKTNHHLSILLNQTSIEEMGVNFAGTVTVTSINPLKLNVKATRGTLNPSAISDFLLKFGFLDEAKTKLIPPITNIESESFTLDYDAGSGDIRLTAQSLIMDQTEFTDVVLSLTRDGSFSVDCTNGRLDAESVYGWLYQIPEGKQLLDESLSGIQLQALSPHGTVHLSSLHLKGSLQGDTDASPPDLEGEMNIDVQDLRLDLVANNGEQGQLTIDAFESRVVIEKGQPTVQIEKMNFHSPGGGTGEITGRIPFPPDLKQTILNSSIDDFKWLDVTVDFHLKKDTQPKATFDLSLSSPSFALTSDGHFYIPGRNQSDLEARIELLRIVDLTSKKGVKPDTSKTTLDQPFATHLISKTAFSAKAWVKKMQWGDYSPLQNVSIDVEVQNNNAVLTGTFRVCGVNCSTNAYLMAPNRLVTTLETKGTDVNLTSLVACFSKELPVYLEGRLYLTGGFSAHGDTPREWVDGAEGDMTITVNRAVVHRVSAMDPRLGFFLDILNTAGIHSGKRDSIRVNRGSVRANIQKGRVVLDRFSLRGPLLNAWGKGEFVIDNQRLRLTGGVLTQLGVTKELDVDRYLKKEGDTG